MKRSDNTKSIKDELDELKSVTTHLVDDNLINIDNIMLEKNNWLLNLTKDELFNILEELNLT